MILPPLLTTKTIFKNQNVYEFRQNQYNKFLYVLKYFLHKMISDRATEYCYKNHFYPKMNIAPAHNDPLSITVS